MPEYPQCVLNPDETGLQDVFVYESSLFLGGLGASMKGMAVGRKQGSAQWHIYEFNNDGLSNGDRARCSGYYTLCHRQETRIPGNLHLLVILTISFLCFRQ